LVPRVRKISASEVALLASKKLLVEDRERLTINKYDHWDAIMVTIFLESC
jgi:hypothetical protein